MILALIERASYPIECTFSCSLWPDALFEIYLLSILRLRWERDTYGSASQLKLSLRRSDMFHRDGRLSREHFFCQVGRNLAAESLLRYCIAPGGS
jgi:hypothetical protein